MKRRRQRPLARKELTVQPKSPDEGIVLGGVGHYIDFGQKSRIEAGQCRRIVTSEPTETWDDLVHFLSRKKRG